MTYLYCKVCPVEWDVSDEDPDAALSDAMNHIDRRHPMSDPVKVLGEGVRP